MKEEYFGIQYEFDHAEVDRIIEEHIKDKRPGYVVSLDGNNFSIAMENPNHLRLINNAIVNNCDSHWVPWMINRIYGTKYESYIGADLFINYIDKKKYRQFFLGSNKKVLNGLKAVLTEHDPAIRNMHFVELPFCPVNEFNYKSIAEMINADAPDIIWVSLGCPKQELFMENLLPLLNQGVMFGFGAIFNFYSGLDDSPKRAPKWMLDIGMEFVYRLFSEPKKQWGRCKNIIRVFPKAYRAEKALMKDRGRTNNSLK